MSKGETTFALNPDDPEQEVGKCLSIRECFSSAYAYIVENKKKVAVGVLTTAVIGKYVWDNYCYWTVGDSQASFNPAYYECQYYDTLNEFTEYVMRRYMTPPNDEPHFEVYCDPKHFSEVDLEVTEETLGLLCKMFNPLRSLYKYSVSYALTDEEVDRSFNDSTVAGHYTLHIFNRIMQEAIGQIKMYAPVEGGPFFDRRFMAEIFPNIVNCLTTG